MTPDDDVRTFAQSVQGKLAADILSGRLAPDTRLRLVALCERYDVSMSPLREALAGLAGRGLVVQEGQRGFRVAPATAEDLRDVMQSRVHLEVMALRLAMQQGGDVWEAGILAAHHRLRRNPRSESLLIDETWEALHRDYHMALIAACGLPRLLGFCAILHDHFDRYRRLGVLRAGRHPTFKGNHGAIVKSVVGRDHAKAQALLTAHIEASAAQFASFLARDGSPPVRASA